MLNESIQDAARRFALLVASDITRVTLHGPFGKSVTIAITPRDIKTAAEESLTPEVRPGWDFTSHVAKFDGQPIQIFGRKLGLLRVLAEATGPITIQQMKAGWHDYDPEDGSVRWTVGDLRKTLKQFFPECEDPISNDDSGYTLTIK
jgi:hypothetical protein